MNPSNSTKISFSGLNEIRAIAAFLVVFHHLESLKKSEWLTSIYDIKFLFDFVKNIGHNGVILFFTLSGFLITYLLLFEKKKFGFIDIKSFYVRRILRIWPLYFLIIIIGFFILPLINEFSLFDNQKYYTSLIRKIDYTTLPLYILFLSNFALGFYKPIVGASQSWSVSVEEQFYLLWPWLVNKITNTKLLFFLILSIAVLKPIIEILITNNNLKMIIHVVQIEYMCTGSLFAILLYTDKIPIVFTKHRILILSITIVAILFQFVFHINNMLISLFFGVFILIISQSKFKNKPLFYFGKISYGIYMYHPFIMFICFSLAKHLAKNELLFNAIYYSSTLLFTILISHLSYYYFESKFLNFKHKFTKIESGA
ncbi:MAG: acyltransferase [Bacteroidota bacterium]